MRTFYLIQSLSSSTIKRHHHHRLWSNSVHGVFLPQFHKITFSLLNIIILFPINSFPTPEETTHVIHSVMATQTTNKHHRCPHQPNHRLFLLLSLINSIYRRTTHDMTNICIDYFPPSARNRKESFILTFVPLFFLLVFLNQN
jgi:hypothetical protein